MASVGSATDMPPEAVMRALAHSSCSMRAAYWACNSNCGFACGKASVEAVPIIEFSAMADLASSGRYGERWLVLNATSVAVVSVGCDEVATVDLCLPLAALLEARLESLVDSGSLLFHLRSGETVEALRFTARRGRAFTRAASAIKSCIVGEHAFGVTAEELSPKSCSACGDPLPDDTNVCVRCVDKRAVLLRLSLHIRPYPIQVALIIGLMLVGSLLSALSPKVLQILVDNVLVSHDHINWIAPTIATLVLVNLVGVAVNVWRSRVAAFLSNSIVHSIRTSLYEHLQLQSISYHDSRKSGALINRITQDVDEVQAFAVNGIQVVVVNSFQVIFIILILMASNWQLTILALLPIPFCAYFTTRAYSTLWDKLHRLYVLRSKMSERVNSVLSGIKVVKAFAQGPRESQVFQGLSSGLSEAQVNVDSMLATYFPFLAFGTTLGVYLIWLYGGIEVVHNKSNSPLHGITLGSITMFLAYAGMLNSIFSQMTGMADWLSRTSASAERIFEVLDSEPEITDTRDTVRVARMEGRVELRNVGFAYRGNESVLSDVSLTVEAGEMIGLVGHTGAGKSTLINLIMRFYEAQVGTVLIDGIDIRDIDIGDLRGQIGVVLQEPLLFPATIADNIGYARPHSTRADIIRAAKEAHAHDFIMSLADGYDTEIGENGTQLSGGERQRVSIARAILCRPRILILDEATASVDCETESMIQKSITRLVAGRTTFAIAHRLSTLRNASRLVVIDKGRIVEVGSHDELMSREHGRYRRLVESQLEVNRRDPTTVVI